MAIYYEINEEAAKRANEAFSLFEYKPGSATAEYRRSVDQAVEVARKQKAKVDTIFHEKIDQLVDVYAKKLAENMNHRFEIDARLPSVWITGASNYPMQKKRRQEAAQQKNIMEWKDIQGLLDKIRSTGMGGISADRPDAVQKLQEKLEGREAAQKKMRTVNAYFKKYGTLEGCAALDPVELEAVKADMERDWHANLKPYPSYMLSNNSAEIRRLKARIEELKEQAQVGFLGWEFYGGHVVANQEYNRLQLFFDEKPSDLERSLLRRNGFVWAGSQGAWQRKLNHNAIYAAGQLPFLKPLCGKTPMEIQPKRETRRASKEEISL